MIEWFKSTWKGVLTIVGVLAVITSLTTFYSTLATSADLAKEKQERVLGQEEMMKTIRLNRNLDRLNTVTDSLMKARIQQRSYPRDKDIAADVEQLKVDKLKLQQEIEGR